MAQVQQQMQKRALQPGTRPRSVAQVVPRAAPTDRVGPIFLAGVISLTSATLVLNPPAWADEDEAPAAPLSAYERSKLEMERRRELLRQARERAAAAQAEKAAESGVATPAAEEEAPARSMQIRSFKLDTPKPTPAPAEEEPAESKSTEYKGFSFGLPKFEAPAPAPEVAAPPPPPPKPVVAPKPVEAVKAAAKAEEQPASKKRRGPLPLFLAQVLVLGLFAGVGAAATKYNEQTTKVLNTAGDFIKSTYQQVEQSLAK